MTLKEFQDWLDRNIYSFNPSPDLSLSIRHGEGEYERFFDIANIRLEDGEVAIYVD